MGSGNGLADLTTDEEESEDSNYDEKSDTDSVYTPTYDEDYLR